ncbi:Pycsar system effector family protein [Actinocorallia populi]|uniref:Pycsar system effector family protein n=1 Tax=Actinocorallia populi TaxID=2079200 RepID=UPI000D091465|nr:Pycsar system effector family protein [Actinocorallia populi]
MTSPTGMGSNLHAENSIRATRAIGERLESLTEAVRTAAAQPQARVTSENGRILLAELAAVRGELVRVDAKCATLTALAGAGLAFLLQASAQRADLVVRVLLAAAALCWTAAALLLLVGVLRPALGSSGFCRWSGMTHHRILAEVDQQLTEDLYAAEELAVLSRIAVRKYTALRQAVVLLAAGVVVLAAATLAGVIA